MRVSNILAKASMEQRLQVFIDNEMNIILNGEQTINNLDAALLFTGFENNNASKNGIIKELDHYYSYASPMKGVLKAILQIERLIHCIETLNVFRSSYEQKMRFTKALEELADDLDNSGIGENEELQEAITAFALKSLYQTQESKEKAEKIYEASNGKIEEFLRKISVLLVYVEKTKENFGFKVQSVDKRIQSIRNIINSDCKSSSDDDFV